MSRLRLYRADYRLMHLKQDKRDIPHVGLLSSSCLSLRAEILKIIKYDLGEGHCNFMSHSILSLLSQLNRFNSLNIYRHDQMEAIFVLFLQDKHI